MRRIVLALLLTFAAAPAIFGQCNSIPVATDDQVDYFGRAISVEALVNDRELDGEALELTLASIGDCDTASAASSPISVLVDNGRLRLVPVHEGHATTCTLTYGIEDEHGFTATARVVVRTVGPFFLDGFESGNTARWHLTVTSGSPPEP